MHKCIRRFYVLFIYAAAAPTATAAVAIKCNKMRRPKEGPSREHPSLGRRNCNDLQKKSRRLVVV